MSKPMLFALSHLLFLISVSGVASAREVVVRWLSPSSGAVAGFNLYIASSRGGLASAMPIDVGRPKLDASGVSSVRITNLDAGLVLGFEMTSYDSLRRESRRSNILTVAPNDSENPSDVVWAEDFEDSAVGSVPVDFAALAQAFKVAEFSDGNRALAGQSSATLGLIGAEYVGSDSLGWGGYEVSGKLMLLRTNGVGGIAVRADEGLDSFFGLGGDGSGRFGLTRVGKAPLSCANSTSTGTSVETGVWFRFRLRVTDPSGVSRLRAKVWRVGLIEPVSWQTDCWTKVALPLGSRELALYGEGSGRIYWDDLVVQRMLSAPEPIP